MRGRQTLPGWIGAGRWLSPDFSFSPFQGGNPGINALASLLLPIPSLRWPASLVFQKKWKTLAGGGQGKRLEAYSWKQNNGGGARRSRDGSVPDAGYPRISRSLLFKEEIPG
ncbi:hypothetical protein [Paenibacillus sp. AN1007]|uniref:Uncharacterized protein n=1 Tax=Paenibacillus sp. AN1007 TaxID=3151385 RepID=A0AAU8NE73_9BACL